MQYYVNNLLKTAFFAIFFQIYRKKHVSRTWDPGISKCRLITLFYGTQNYRYNRNPQLKTETPPVKLIMVGLPRSLKNSEMRVRLDKTSGKY